MVGEALKKLEPEPRNGGRILFVKLGYNNGNAIPMVEVKFESRETALHIRGRYVQLKKDNVDLGTLHLANCVSLATRVRADILRALADKLNDGKRLGYFVSSYNSRPVLHFKNSGRDQAITFVDAIEKYGNSVKDEDLSHAYRRCGKSFKGQLGQHFVILKDQPQAHQAQDQHHEGGRGRGRGRGGQWQRQQYQTPGRRGTTVAAATTAATSGRGKVHSGLPRGGVSTSANKGSTGNTSKKRKFDEANPRPKPNLTRTGIQNQRLGTSSEQNPWA